VLLGRLRERLLPVDDALGPGADLVAVAAVLVVLQDLRRQQVLGLVGVRLVECVADLEPRSDLGAARGVLRGVGGPRVIGLAGGLHGAGEQGREEGGGQQGVRHRSGPSTAPRSQGRRGSSTSAVPAAVTSSRWFRQSTAQRTYAAPSRSNLSVTVPRTQVTSPM